MTSFVRNSDTKNYKYLITGFQVGMFFWTQCIHVYTSRKTSYLLNLTIRNSVSQTFQQVLFGRKSGIGLHER